MVHLKKIGSIFHYLRGRMNIFMLVMVEVLLVICSNHFSSQKGDYGRVRNDWAGIFQLFNFKNVCDNQCACFDHIPTFVDTNGGSISVFRPGTLPVELKPLFLELIIYLNFKKYDGSIYKAIFLYFNSPFTIYMSAKNPFFFPRLLLNKYPRNVVLHV